MRKRLTVGGLGRCDQKDDARIANRCQFPYSQRRRQSYSPPAAASVALAQSSPTEMNNFGNRIRKRKAPRIEARGRRPPEPCPGALIGRETVSRKVAAASPFEQIGEEAARIASRGSSFLISHKHGRDSTTVGRPSGTTVQRLSHKRCGKGGSIFTPARPRGCLRFRTLWLDSQ